MRVSVSKINSNSNIYFQNRFFNRVNNDNPEYQYEYERNFDYKKTAAYSASVIAAGLGIVYITKNLNVSKYSKTLANSLQTAINTKVKPQDFSSVINGEELLRFLPKFKNENYIATSQNINNGIFKIDLRSRSNYTDGKGYVKNILEDAAEYADILYKKTKQKFIFSFTDQGTLESTKEALEVIASNPEMYKNLNFVPAVEISFAHKSPKSNNPCEVSELLVYGINPFSDNLNKFINNMKTKRTKMINDLINEASEKFSSIKFSFNEFNEFYDYEKFGNMMNIHWRVNHYLQTKQAVNILAERTNQDTNTLYKSIMEHNKGASLGQLHQYGKIPYDISENQELNNIFRKYSPHIENDKIVAASENTFEEVIEALKNEPNITISLANPLYFAERVENPYKEIKYLVENSNGLLKSIENYYQGYDNPNGNSIENLQKISQKLNLINTGGRNNRENKFF